MLFLYFQVTCSIIAGFLHFFFLSSFSWMFVEGIHILFMLVQVFDSAKSRLKYYYLLGYGKNQRNLTFMDSPFWFDTINLGWSIVDIDL